MNKNPLVSLIVRTKDRPKMLVKALKSIVAQTYRPIEVVLVNDGGCALNTKDIESNLGNCQCRYIPLEENHGRAHAGNVGLSNATGSYIGFLDDDDDLLPQHLDTLVTFLEISDFNIAYSDCEIVNKQYDIDKQDFIDAYSYVFYSEDFNYKTLLLENYIPIHCLLFKKSAIIGNSFDEGFDLFEDWDLLIRIATTYPFHHIKKTTAHYNNWDRFSQITHASENVKSDAYFKVLKKHRDKITEEIIHNYSLVGNKRKCSAVEATKISAERYDLMRKLSDEILKSSEQQNKIVVLEDINRQLNDKIHQLAVLDANKEVIRTLRFFLQTQKEQIENELPFSKIIMAYLEAIFAFIENMEHLSGKDYQPIINDFITLIHRMCEIERFNLNASASVFWKLAQRYYGLRDRFFPEGSRQKEIYNLLKRTISLLNTWQSLSTITKPIPHSKTPQTEILPPELTKATIDNTPTATPVDVPPKWPAKWINTSALAELPPLEFYDTDAPITSIIIPVHNNLLFTFNCLKSILENTTPHTYEVIVVNNASTDHTSSLLEGILNIRTISNDFNAGYGAACNQGAKEARGKYLLFLNNDTMVAEGWLDALLEVMSTNGKAGAVGSRLIYPDGRLQEAGGIIFSDGSGCNYGRGENADEPAYNYLKEVDYCSGASLLITRELFETLNGFDPQYDPAYYEDADLCFSVRKAGYKVIYQPKSVVVHFEGTTAGTDTSEGFKTFQEVNRSKFVHKWKHVLASQQRGIDELFVARERITGKIILIVDLKVPAFDKDASSVRMYQIIKIFLRYGHKVIYLPFDGQASQPYTDDLQQMGVEILHGKINAHDFLNRYGSFLDVVMLCRPMSIHYIDLVKTYAINARVLFDTVDLHFVREQRRAVLQNNTEMLQDAEQTKTIELSLCEKSDVTIVVSDVEKAILAKERPLCNIKVLPLIFEPVKVTNPFGRRNCLMFIGGFDHHPNEDGIVYFVNDVMPLIQQRIPNIKLYIVGNMPPKSVTDLNSYNVIVTGHVVDVTSYFVNCRVFVSPLRYGAGVKGKIAQSMSYGLPVVTTSIGAEGFVLEDRKTALIADNPQLFADCTVELYSDKRLWNRLSSNSVKFVENNFSIDKSTERILDILA
ncbi:MAG: glycosyltransferase [Nitrospirae bacterium]|nr:glycosyltransferase [Nitrospirota bacterium]